MNKERLNYLDSVRGIAACIVVLHHCWLAFGNTVSGINAAFASLPTFFTYLFQKILAGHAAVIIFFVLSGFVLALSSLKQPMSYAGFTIKRIFRIYPAFVFVVLSSYALHLILGVDHDGGSEFLRNSVINADLSWVTLIKHLVLWGTQKANRLDCVIWSLVHEVRISLIFPLILLAVRKQGRRALLGFFSLSLACSTLQWSISGKIATGIEETTILERYPSMPIQ
jgi:peptidoglycan/LPS O-acetylase OafA/YrhL